MRLSALLGDHGAAGDGPVVTGLAIDHRKVAPGTIFGAFVGEKFNGEDFIPAAIAAGAIAMGLGGYLAAHTDIEHFKSEEARETWEIEHKRDFEVNEVRQIFETYGLEGAALTNVVDAISANPRRWTDFMMRFELGLEQPDPKRAPLSAATIAIAYLVGGFIPLAPYIAVSNIPDALKMSVLTTGIALAIFGAIKGRFTGVNPFRSAVQTLLVGGLAAGAAYWLAHLLG